VDGLSGSRIYYMFKVIVVVSVYDPVFQVPLAGITMLVIAAYDLLADFVVARPTLVLSAKPILVI
jgi:hypothetical protein